MLSISLALSITLSVFYVQVPWYAICFSYLTIIFFGVAFFYCFNNRIVFNINKNELKFCSIKHKTFKIEEIEDLTIETENSINENKYCFIVAQLNTGDSYKISGYLSIFNKHAVKISEQKINLLKEKIFNKWLKAPA